MKVSGCWASSLDDCAGSLSAEHIVSRAALQKVVTVQGLPWCKDQPKRIGTSSFTAKHLCEHHNSSLARYDAAAETFLETFTAVFETRARHEHFWYSKNRPVEYKIDGYGLERWMCKTLINIALVQNETSPTEIEYLLPYLYRGEEFKEPFGLFFALDTARSGDWASDIIQIVPRLSPEKMLVGSLITIRSFRFVLLLPGSVDPFINGELPLGPENTDWEGLQLNWHHKTIRIHAGRHITQIVTIKWNP